MSAVMSQNRVLVLNKGWTAVGIATVERAFNLIMSEYANGQPKARIIDPQDFQAYTWDDWSKITPKSDESVIHTARQSFRLPEVVLLSRYEKMPQQRVHFSRRTIYRRDNYTCQYCGCRPGSEELSIDHIVPRSRGGQTSWTNTVLACVKCNSRKADKLPEEVGFKRPHPSKPKFNLLRGDRVTIPKSWNAFVSEAYWLVELQNDNLGK
jgi:5-methylcytosine-specific restriction endonuclease McrA